MNKDEILEKSRAQKKDEGEEFAENKGRRAGVVAFCIIFIIILFFNTATGQNNFAPYSMFWAYMAAEAYGKYRVTKEKKLLVTLVFAAIASVLFLACHVIEVMGWNVKL